MESAHVAAKVGEFQKEDVGRKRETGFDIDDSKGLRARTSEYDSCVPLREDPLVFLQGLRYHYR